MNKRIYVCSDLHGEASLFKQIVDYIHLSKNEDLYILGDYCDYGTETAQLLLYLHKLTMTHSNVFCTLGNHEAMFLNFVYQTEDIKNEYISSGYAIKTIKTFLSDEAKEILLNLIKENHGRKGLYTLVSDYVIPIIKRNKDLLKWMKELPNYIEIEKGKIIGVHAGLSENEYWKHSTGDEEFIWKYPPEIGDFFIAKQKQLIIAGHVSTDIFKRTDGTCNNDILYDKQSHIYIANHHTGIIPLLIIDKISNNEYKLSGVRCDKNISNDHWEVYDIDRIKL